MRKIALAAALLAAALAAPASAAELTRDTRLGVTADEVKASLAALGCEVRKVETEDDEIEAYFVGEGRMGEVYVSARTGMPTKIEIK